jgi:hypothetical protein
VRRHATTPLLALLPLVTALACSKAAPPYEGPRGPEVVYACDLFPGLEAEAELRGLEIGQASGPLDASSGKKYARCAYGHGPQALVVASLEIRRHDSPAILKRKAEAAIPLFERLTKAPVERIDGIGDFAYWAGGELRLLKAGWRDLELLVTFAPTSDDPAYNRAAAERIAKRAIYRLQELPIPDELRLGTRSVSLASPPAAPAAEAPSASP